MKYIFSVLGLVFLLGACSTHQTEFTMISTRNVAINKKDIDNLPQKKNIIGQDKKIVLLGITLGTPIIQAAVDDALDKGNGDLIVDASLYQTYWSILLLGQTGYEIKGTVVNTRQGEN